MNQIEQTLTSLEVAEMVEKEHKYLMRDIKRYSNTMTGAKISLVDFWSESTYEDKKGELRPCYLITKKGCEFIAHKVTGEKGIIFTAKYINRFHDMEQALYQQIAEGKTILRRKPSWMAEMEENFKFLCEAYKFTRKNLYHHILVDIGKIYDIEEAKAIYVQEKGYEPWYIMDVVEYFPQLRQAAEITVSAHIEKAKKRKELKENVG